MIINFSIPIDGYVQLKLIDISGRIIKDYSGEYGKGENRIEIKDIPMGVYFINMVSDDYLKTEKFINLR